MNGIDQRKAGMDLVDPVIRSVGFPSEQGVLRSGTEFAHLPSLLSGKANVGRQAGRRPVPRDRLSPQSATPRPQEVCGPIKCGTGILPILPLGSRVSFMFEDIF